MGFAVNLIGALFVSVYLLLDVRRIKAAYLRALPHRYRWDGRELWNAEGTSLSKYLGGLALVIVIQGSLTTLGLFIFGVPYAIVLGAWVSLTAIIPYLGAFLGAIPGVIIAFSFGSTTTGVLVALLYLGIQQLEGNVLTPRIQGQALRVHPIIVLLAIVIGGELGGARRDHRRCPGPRDLAGPLRFPACPPGHRRLARPRKRLSCSRSEYTGPGASLR